jgi:hypothetical protein
MVYLFPLSDEDLPMRYTLLRKLFGRKNQSSSRQKPVRFRPWLEYLETRELLNGATWFVNAAATGSQDGSSAHPFATIQQGVNAADVNGGDTVKVEAGTYNELVQVTKSVTILGAQSGVDARTRSGGPESIVSNSTGDFMVTGDNVTIDGFTLEGVNSSPNVNPQSFGAAIWTNPGYQGTHGGLQALNNIIQNNIIGLELDNDGTYQSKVYHNLFRDNNLPGSNSGLDIAVDFGLSNALIDSNTFTNTSFVENSWALGTEAPSSQITFSNNAVTNSGRGVFFYATNNITVTGSTFTGTSHYAIGAFGSVNGLDAEKNTIQNGGTALFVEDDLGSPGTPAPNSNIQAHFNNIVGNAQNVVISSDGSSPNGYTGTLDATNNWWGSPTGPAPGTIVGSVNVSPFLLNPFAPTVSPTSGPVAGGTIVNLTGMDLRDTTAVHFGAVAATVFHVNLDGSVTATAPAAASAGPVDVTVTTLAGTTFASPSDVFTYLAVPAVTGVAPNSGVTSGGTNVTITGSGFTGATAVAFGTTPATSFHVVNDNTITAIAPAQGAGTVDVKVTAPGGTSAISGADQFTYVVAGTPFVTGLSTNAGPTSGGALLYVQGRGFTGATSVTFGGTPATFFVLSDNQIQVFTPAHAAGTVDVKVTNAVGTSIASSADQYTYQAAAAPSVTSVSPNSGPAIGGNTVTIHGSNFNTATNVKFGSVNAAGFTVINNTTITATAPAGAGTVDVVVVNPGGSSATSAADRYTFVAAPTVTGVSPASGPLVGGNTVTITGTGFTGATAVNFGSTPASSFTVVNSTTITARVPAASAAGLVDITVVTAGGTSGVNSLDQYTYVSQAPSVTSLSPVSGPTSGGTVVTINGSGFTDATGVKFGATNAAFTVLSDSQIQATAPAGAGTVNVTVTGPAGTSAVTPADQFSYVVVAPPSVTGVSPNTGATSGGTVVTITGSGFTGASAVTFGGVNALSFTVVNSTTITATSPSGTGIVDVRVTTLVGQSAATALDHFTYVAAGAPTVSSLSATSGPSSGGTLVLITGSGFTGATSVTFGGTPATFFLVQSPTQIMALAPAHAAGTVNVIVTNAIGASVPNPNDQFTYF